MIGLLTHSEMMIIGIIMLVFGIIGILTSDPSKCGRIGVSIHLIFWGLIGTLAGLFPCT